MNNISQEKLAKNPILNYYLKFFPLYFHRTNVFLYMAIMGILEIPAVVFGTPVANVFSRKVILGGSLLIAGTFTLLELVTPASKSDKIFSFVLA